MRSPGQKIKTFNRLKLTSISTDIMCSFLVRLSFFAGCKGAYTLNIHFRKIFTERKTFCVPHAQYDLKKNHTAHAVREIFSDP